MSLWGCEVTLQSSQHLKTSYNNSISSLTQDNLLTRIVNLSMNAKHRKTRVAACECLHVTTVFLIGRSATQVSCWGSLLLLVAVDGIAHRKRGADWRVVVFILTMSDLLGDKQKAFYYFRLNFDYFKAIAFLEH